LRGQRTGSCVADENRAYEYSSSAPIDRPIVGLFSFLTDVREFRLSIGVGQFDGLVFEIK
jgi:hypothetical protein